MPVVRDSAGACDPVEVKIQGRLSAEVGADGGSFEQQHAGRGCDDSRGDHGDASIAQRDGGSGYEEWLEMAAGVRDRDANEQRSCEA